MCVFIAAHHFHKSQLVQCVQCVCCVGLSEGGTCHGEYLNTKEWMDSMTTKIPKHAQRIHIITFICCGQSPWGMWMGLSELKQYYCLKPLVLQAKNEVADMREVMDNWHHHCQVRYKVHDLGLNPIFMHYLTDAAYILISCWVLCFFKCIHFTVFHTGFPPV